MTAITLLGALISTALSAEPISISSATHDGNGALVHEVQSPFQPGKTQIRVLLPDVRQPDQKYRTVYVLPVEAHREARYGDGLSEAKAHDLHNKHAIIFVAPTFSH